MISQGTIDKIFNTAQIEDVVSDFVHLKKRGANLLGLCPFHDEKTPSFTVSPTKNIYKCFGCGKGGNSVQFIMEHEQTNYPETLRYLAEKFGIEIEETESDPLQVQKAKERESLYLINKFAQEYFEKQLFDTDYGKSIGLSYFRQRAYSEKTIRHFQLGLSPASGDHFTREAVAKGYKIEFLRELGLTSDKDRDFFRSRVMFPIHNVSGKIVAFAGRSLTQNKRSPKYINSPESDVYNKSWVLYGMHLAKKSVAQEDECLLVEGYTDVISLHQQGIENVVASSGTSLTDGQIKLIKRYTPNVLILYDGDAAGIKAAMRGIDLILAQDMNVKIVILPDGHDPDSFMKEKGVSGFKDFLKSASQDFILFKSSLLLKEAADDPIKKTKLIRDIVGSIAMIPDVLKRSLYVQKCAERFDIREEVLMDTLNNELYALQKRASVKSQRPGDRSEQRPMQVIRQRQDQKKEHDVISDETQERDIIRILISHGHEVVPEAEDSATVGDYLLHHVMEDLIDNFDNQLYEGLLKEYAKLRSEGVVTLDQNFFINHSNLEVSKLAASFLSEKYEYSTYWESRFYVNPDATPSNNYIKDLELTVLRLKLRKVNKLIRKNTASIEQLKGQLEDSDALQKMDRAIKIHSHLISTRNDIATLLNQVVV